MTETQNKCTYTPDSPADSSPHRHIRGVAEALVGPTSKVMDTILNHIGNTPLVKLNRVAEELECDILVKCEYFNAGGSVKDRIGLRMIEDAELTGRIKPGDTLIEPTSGNTGIGLALAAAIKGYKMIVTLPEKMSSEKVDVLKALGAQIVRTPDDAASDSPESHIGVAKRLNKDIPNSHILDQYSNPSNPLAHYDGTAEELIKQTNGEIDMVVIGAGTGGTITGIAKKLKEKIPNVEVVGVDPVGSILAQPADLNTGITGYKVEGIGYDFVPIVLERQYIDSWIKTNDKESFLMSRRLIREEGLLCGGSSGSAMVGALKAARKLKKGQKCVVILPDSVRNYMSKFLNDDWMLENGFEDEKIREETKVTEWWASLPLSSLQIPTPFTVLPTVTCEDAVQILRAQGFDQLPVIDENSNVLGMVTEGNILAMLQRGRASGKDPISKVLYRQFKQVPLDATLGELSQIFERHHYALVIHTQRVYSGVNELKKKKVIYGVVTRIDLLNFIMGADRNKKSNL